MKTRSLIVLMAILTILSLGKDTYAQKKRPSSELLNDIEIMETVLDKLIKPNSSPDFFMWGRNSRGFYLLDYGVIFNINYSLLGEGLIEFQFDDLIKARNDETYFIKKDSEEKIDVNKEKEMEQLKNSLTRFLGLYASTIRDLQADENVSVIVDFNGFIGNFGKSHSGTPKQLIASIKMAELQNFRQGKTTEAVFQNKIQYANINTFDEDISILGNVIKTSLEHADKMKSFGLASDIKGVHFKGYGVLFITNIDWGLGEMHPLIFRDRNQGKIAVSISSDEQNKSAKNRENDLKNFEQKLMRSISNYGHTLRSMQPDEWVELAVSFKGAPVMEKYSKSIIKVKKKSIDDFYRDRINFDQFQKLVQIFYY